MPSLLSRVTQEVDEVVRMGKAAYRAATTTETTSYHGYGHIPAYGPPPHQHQAQQWSISSNGTQQSSSSVIQQHSQAPFQYNHPQAYAYYPQAGCTNTINSHSGLMGNIQQAYPPLSSGFPNNVVPIHRPHNYEQPSSHSAASVNAMEQVTQAAQPDRPAYQHANSWSHSQRPQPNVPYSPEDVGTTPKPSQLTSVSDISHPSNTPYFPPPPRRPHSATANSRLRRTRLPLEPPPPYETLQDVSTPLSQSQSFPTLDSVTISSSAAKPDLPPRRSPSYSQLTVLTSASHIVNTEMAMATGMHHDLEEETRPSLPSRRLHAQSVTAFSSSFERPPTLPNVPLRTASPERDFAPAFKPYSPSSTDLAPSASTLHLRPPTLSFTVGERKRAKSTSAAILPYPDAPTVDVDMPMSPSDNGLDDIHPALLSPISNRVSIVPGFERLSLLLAGTTQPVSPLERREEVSHANSPPLPPRHDCGMEMPAFPDVQEMPAETRPLTRPTALIPMSSSAIAELPAPNLLPDPAGPSTLGTRYGACLPQATSETSSSPPNVFEMQGDLPSQPYSPLLRKTRPQSPISSVPSTDAKNPRNSPCQTTTIADVNKSSEESHPDDDEAPIQNLKRQPTIPAEWEIHSGFSLGYGMSVAATTMASTDTTTTSLATALENE